MTNLLKKLEEWNEAEEYQQIIDAIEALPEKQKTTELTGLLARAYNNVAQPGERALFWKAAKLLHSIESECSGEHNWNFRLGYSYLYLDMERKALPYFEKALEIRPGDEDTQELIDMCNRGLALPLGLMPFRERTQKGWESFLDGEAELREKIDKKSGAEELVGLCHRLLSPAFDDIQFELGFNGEKHELILTPEGDPVRLFQLQYFKEQAPDALAEHWNILVGRQPGSGFSLGMHGKEISADDVQIWTELLEGKEVGLSLYCEKLSELLLENEDAAYSMMAILLDQVLGEITAIRCIGYMDLLEKPQEGDSILLSALPAYIKAQVDPQNYGSANSSKQFCENYVAYEQKPTEDEDWNLREDVFAGITCCPKLINQYFEGEEEAVNSLHQDGAVAGFFWYSLSGIDRDQILDLRDNLEKQIKAQAGEDTVTFIGGATGECYGYLDFLAWDFGPVLEAADAAFASSPVQEAGFHSFRRNVGGVSLKNEENEE